MSKTGASSANSNIIVIYDEYRSNVHRFPFVDTWSCPDTKRTQGLHVILNDRTKSDEEKVKELETIVSSMKSQEELVALLSGKDRDGCTLLHLAAYHDSEKCCKFLIRWGVNINEGNSLGYSPLFYATIGDGLKSARVLLRHGADPKVRAFMDTRKTCSWICFHYAQFMKRVDMLMLIFHFHTDVLACTLNVKEEKYNTLLFNLDPAVMKRCLLMYRKYCYDTELEKAHCLSCGVRSARSARCSNCFIATYCSRDCHMMDFRHMNDCYDDDFSVIGDYVRSATGSRIKNLVFKFYGTDVFPAFILMTSPFPSVLFIGFGRILLVRVPPGIQNLKAKKRLQNPAVVPVWAQLLSTSVKAGDMKLYLRKSMPENEESKSVDKDMFVFNLQNAM